MLMTAKSKERLASSAREVASESWAVQDPVKHTWIGLAVADAVEYANNVEMPQLYAAAPNGENADREKMRLAIRRRIMDQNEKCGFIILPIILAAVLTWIIKRILDRWFNGDYKDE